MSKVLEKVVYNSLIHHIQHNHLLPKTQSGFRSQYSTVTAMIKITTDIAKSIDDSKVTYLALLDYSKAFDVIDRDLLIAKLHYYGINEQMLKWFRNYLSSRYQAVKIENNISVDLSVSYGVPQGSILGPILFTIFTADLPSVLRDNWNIHLYADDTQVYKSCLPLEVNGIVSELNNNLQCISEWSKSNGLRLNPSKTTVICIGSKSAVNKANVELTQQIVLNDTVISISENVRDLGIIIDKNINFEKHAIKKCGEGYAKLKSLWKFKDVLPQDIKWNLTNALILSCLDYGSCVYYHFLSNEVKNKLQILQNSCLRFSFSIARREHITPYYNRFSILKLELRFLFLYSTLLYKIIHSRQPSYLYSLLVKRCDIHTSNIGLRSDETYTIPQHKTTKFEGCFEYIAPKVINNHQNIFNETSTSKFRCKLKSCLFNIQSQTNV